MILKVGRHEYKISREDLFMDNGACVQLLSQSREKVRWGKRHAPILSKRAVKEISKFNKIQKPHRFAGGVDVEVFSLEI
jgi:hypothetical protein